MTKEIVVSYSEVKDARRCSFKHDLAWRYRYRREHDTDSPLTFGVAWHEILNAYYDNLETSTAWRSAREKLREQPEEIQPHLEWMLEGYAAYYGCEPGWKVLATEREFIVPLPQLFDDLIVNLKVIIDLVIRDPRGNVWVDDHKSCSQLPTERNQVDPQLPLYCYALLNAGNHWQWPKPFGARYSYALKPPKTMQFKKHRELKDRFRRRRVPHTLHEVNAIATDVYKTIYSRYREAELYLYGGRTIQPDCSSFCDYETACKASRKGYSLSRFLDDGGFTGEYVHDPKEPK